MLEIRLHPGESIRRAVESVPFGEPARIRLSDGLYREKLLIDRPGLTLTGDSRAAVISWDDYAEKPHPADGKPFNTFRTYTVQITADDVRLESLSIENTAGDPARRGQSVALSAYGDRLLVTDCRLSSTQDTLFAGPLPDDLVVRYDGFLPDPERYREGGCVQQYRDCLIEGSVDFVFGCASAHFLGCELRSVNDGRDRGFVAAPAHSLKQRDGFVFARCRFTGSGLGDAAVYLARPWRDFGKAAFVECTIGAHIHPALFDKWNDTGRDRTARFSFFELSGIGTCGCVPWAKRLTEAEAHALLARAEAALTSP